MEREAEILKNDTERQKKIIAALFERVECLERDQDNHLLIIGKHEETISRLQKKANISDIYAI